MIDLGKARRLLLPPPPIFTVRPPPKPPSLFVDQLKGLGRWSFNRCIRSAIHFNDSSTVLPRSDEQINWFHLILRVLALICVLCCIVIAIFIFVCLRKLRKEEKQYKNYAMNASISSKLHQRPERCSQVQDFCQCSSKPLTCCEEYYVEKLLPSTEDRFLSVKRKERRVGVPLSFEHLSSHQYESIEEQRFGSTRRHGRRENVSPSQVNSNSIIYSTFSRSYQQMVNANNQRNCSRVNSTAKIEINSKEDSSRPLLSSSTSKQCSNLD